MLTTPVAAEDSPSHWYWEYTPPEGATMESLTGAYNANVDQVPGFFRGILPSGDDAQIYVLVYNNDDLSVDTDKYNEDDQMSLYSLSLDSDGKVVDTKELRALVDWFSLSVRADRIAFSVSASDMDAIIMASDPAAVAQSLYEDGRINVESAGSLWRAAALICLRVFSLLA